MNINMLRDVDDDAGFYAAACGDAKWKGAVLFQSIDGGTTYTPLATLLAAATMGNVIGPALGDFDGGNIPDEINSITVKLKHGELASVTYAKFINGLQMAVIGDEIVCFRSAALNLDGTYTVSGFLRGRRGSEYAMASHVVGERFVLLSVATMVRIEAVSADIGSARKYKAVTAGRTLAKTTAKNFTNTGAGLKPYSVVQVGGGRNDTGDILLNWVRRGRISGEWRDLADVPLSEAAEAYEVDIMDGLDVVRTISVTSPTATYTTAQQVADFGSAQSSIDIKVYQLSAIVGRGYAAQATV